MKYRIQARPETLIINGKKVHVDSQNEKKLIEWFESNGFSGLWRRSEIGAVVGKSRYTNDFELSVLHDGVTKRAIVEAKPYKSALTPSIVKRMQGIASFYKTDLFLLFSRRDNSWHRIDLATGTLIKYDTPLPGLKPLSKLPRAMSLTSEIRGNHAYQRRLNPLGWLADVVIGVIQGPTGRKHKRR